MQLPEALFNLTSTAADVRNGSEAVLKSMPEDQLVVNLLQCLSFECPDASTQVVVRSMAAVVLRRKLTGGTTVLFKTLDPSVQRQVQATLLEGLAKQQVATIGRKVSDAVVDLAVVIYQEGQWEELTSLLGQLLSSSVDMQRLFGFGVLQQLLELAPPKFTPPPFLHGALQSGLGSGNLTVQVAAIKAYAAALAQYDALSKDSNFDMSGAVLKVLEGCLNSQKEQESEDILQALVDLMETKPNALGAQLQPCIPTMVQVCRSTSTSEIIRRLALDFIVAMVEGFPNQQLPFVQEVLQLSMGLMLEIEDDPHWASQNADYDTREDVLVEAGQIALSSIAGALPSSTFMPALSEVLSKYARAEDWKARHAALLAIVQTGDEFKEDHIRQLIPYILVSLQDSHARVQWAAAQAVSQLVTEHKEWLAEECHPQVMPVLLDKMQCAVPRVVAWVCAALRDLCEHLSAETLEPYLNPLLTRTLTLLQGGLWFVVEKAFQTISWVADTVEEAFRPYYDPYESVLFQFVERPPHKEEEIRGRAMECLTSVGRAVGCEMFRPAAQRFMEMTLSLCMSKTGQFPAGWSAYYVLNAWRRTIETLEAEIVPYLPRLVPMLLCAAASEALAEGQWAADEDDDAVQWVTDANGLRRCVNPSLLEGKAAACEVLQALMQHSKAEFWPYVASVLSGIGSLTTFPLDVKVRSQAAQCLTAAMDCAGDAVTERARLVTDVLQRLLAAVAVEKDSEALVELLKAIRETLQRFGVPLVGLNVAELLDRLLATVEGSVSRAAAAASKRSAGTIDEDELETAQDWEEAAMLRLIGCVRAILTTQGEAALALVEARVQQLWAALSPATEQIRWLVTLGLLVEVLKRVPPVSFPTYFNQCMGQVKDACGSGGFFTPVRSLEVRRLAYTALGLFAQKGGDAFVPNVAATVSMCTALLTLDYDEEEEEQQELRDAAAGALARVFERHMAHVSRPEETLQIWLDWLPIHADDDQVEPCVTVLCQLVLSGPLAPSPNTMTQYEKVLLVLGSVDPEDEDYGVQMKTMVRSVLANASQLPADVISKLFKDLPSSVRKTLEKWRQ